MVLFSISSVTYVTKYEQGKEWILFDTQLKKDIFFARTTLDIH